MKISESQITTFCKSLEPYLDDKQRTLPWRSTQNPYHIMVSEVMLQQTQVNRVIPKYQQWINQWPTIESLAGASTHEALSTWQGLGYNRRGLNLKRAAGVILDTHQGIVPSDKKELLALPGIGEYGAGAILTFAHNQPHLLLETNIRTVLFHHFFSDQETDHKITDRELKTVLAELIKNVSPTNYRRWYWGLMDYGVELKKTIGNLNRQSSTYTRQSAFSGSHRQARSLILQYILDHPLTSLADISQNICLSKKFSHTDILESLIKDGFIQVEDTSETRYTITT